VEIETGNVRLELPLDIEIDSNIVYMIISVPNYSSFSLLKFIFSECRKNSEEFSHKTYRFEQASSTEILMELFPVHS